MKTKWRLLLVLTVVGACLLAALPTGVQAQKKKGADEKPAEEQKADDVNDLVTAYQLANIGRKNEAPEFLITAAGMLRRLSKIKMDAIAEKPMIEVDKGAEVETVDKDAKAASLEDQANDLFDEAEAMGTKLKVDLGKLIKLAKERPNTRAVIGGPRTVSRHIGGKQTQVFHFNFQPNMPCAIGFQASFPLHIMVVRSDNENVWTNATTMVGVHRQIAGGPRQKGAVPVTVRIHNFANQPAQFQLWVN